MAKFFDSTRILVWDIFGNSTRILYFTTRLDSKIRVYNLMSEGAELINVDSDVSEKSVEEIVATKRTILGDSARRKAGN